MPDTTIKIEVQGLEQLQAALRAFPQKTAQYLSQAGNEAASRVIFPEVGIKKYPTAMAHPAQPFVSEKQRRYFFWALRQGIIEVPYRRGQSPGSEKYLDQWYTKRVGYGTEIGNRASYGIYLSGEQQSGYMANLGWKKLIDVVGERMSDIVRVYQAWVDRLLTDVGL